MKNILLVVLLAVIVGMGWMIIQQNNKVPSENVEISELDSETVVPVQDENQDMMNLTVYVQDEASVETVSCGTTKIQKFRIPRTTAVADASLKLLFEEELAKFGTYKSVNIKNGIAEILIDKRFTSLSSCESQHLMSVLEDTLTQYDTVKSIELYSPQGKIEF